MPAAGDVSLPRPFLHFVRERFALDWGWIHGAPHWARVRWNGLVLAERTGASPRVVSAFAFLHDVERRNDGQDPQHGARAAVLVEEIRDLLPLSDEEAGLVAFACAHHSAGWRTADDVSVAVCWDADRLDLGRVWKRPDPERLCTEAARDPGLIELCYRRSRGGWR